MIKSPQTYLLCVEALTFTPMGIFGHFMNLKAVYIHIGWFQMSITNLIIVIGMLVLFGLALTLPFPGNKKGKGQK